MSQTPSDRDSVIGDKPRFPRKVRSLVPRLLDWFAAHARDLPWRRTADPYAIWVSEIMLQQTQVKTVIPYYERWMKALPNIRALAKVSPQELHKLWEGLGYYTRVRNMQRAAQIICRDHAGRFPTDFDNILALPGIGRYTAGAICSIAFNQPAPILDGNVTRVLCRVFGIKSDPREKQTNSRLWQLAEEIVVPAGTQSATRNPHSAINQSLMELGALVCLPRNPLCGDCPVRTQCVAHREALVDSIPAVAQRPAITQRHFVAYIVQQHGRYLVSQRSGDAVNAHLWEFPNEELAAATSEKQKRSVNGSPFKIKRADPICTIKHSITRYRITLDAFPANLSKSGSSGIGKWVTKAELRKLPFTSAHRKIINTLIGTV